MYGTGSLQISCDAYGHQGATERHLGEPSNASDIRSKRQTRRHCAPPPLQELSRERQNKKSQAVVRGVLMSDEDVCGK